MKTNLISRDNIHKLWMLGLVSCACTFGFTSCSDEYDDSELRQNIEGLENRVASLEEWQTSVNTNIQSLKTLVSAIENRNYITGVTPFMEDNVEKGYVIAFQSGNSIIIRHGKDGQDGATPAIGIAKGTDNVYYWTLNGNFITEEDGKRLPVSGVKGDSGTSAIAPQVRINTSTNVWEVSTDGGTVWKEMKDQNGNPVKATGEKGATGDAVFASIDYSDSSKVVFTLVEKDEDNNNIVITVPRASTLLTIVASTTENQFTVTSDLLKEGTGNVVDIRVESENADGTTIITRAAVASRWTIAYSFAGNVMTIKALPATTVLLNETALLKVTVSNASGAVLATAQKVFKNQQLSNADDLKDIFVSATASNVILAQDVAFDKEITVTANKTINLNNHTVTVPNLGASEGGVLTLKDGKIKQPQDQKIYVGDNSTVVLDGITYEGTGYSCIMSEQKSQNTHITIRNSTIHGGYFTVSTNGSTPTGTSTFELENSTFIADETALMVNIPVDLKATNCVFQGGYQAAFVRCGSATFTDCTMNLVMDPEYADYPEKNHKGDYWGTANNSVTAAIVMGNCCKENSTSYNYPSSVTLKNTKFSVKGSIATMTAEETPSVYIWSRVEEGNGATFNYDEASETAFKAAGKGLVIGNGGKNLTINGKAYSAE